MPVFVCRWPNADFSAVSATSREEALELLSEVGNAASSELFVANNFMVHFHIKNEPDGFEEMLPLEFGGFGEQTHRMSSVQIGQMNYEMPPREGISIAHFLTVADIERSARYYEKVFGARILSLGDGNAPAYLQLANIWMILNVGGGPTPDKPTVTLSVPDPNHINSFMNFRVADIQACYELWKSRGAEFITEPIPK